MATIIICGVGGGRRGGGGVRREAWRPKSFTNQMTRLDATYHVSKTYCAVSLKNIRRKAHVRKSHKGQYIHVVTPCSS